MTPEYIAIALVITMLCAITIIFIRKVKRKNEIAQLKSIEKQVSNFEFFESETCRNFVIGVDQKWSKLLFKNQDQSNEITVLELAKYKTCKPVKQSRILKNKNENYAAIESVSLIFEPNHSNTQIATIELFNLDRHMQLYTEWQIAEKWAEKISIHLLEK